MLDVNIYNNIRERDFLAMPGLDLRPYTWGSTAVYNDEVKARLMKYHSKYDLLHWMSYWTEQRRLMSPFTGIEEFEKLKEKSFKAHKKVFNYLYDNEMIKNNYHNGYDIFNAIDSYIIKKNCKDFFTVLDFGSGYGRLGAMFSNEGNKHTYISVDCVEGSYIVQNLFLSLLNPSNFYEYFDYEFLNKTFKIKKKKSIYHIPSWRLDLVEDQSVDLITSVFVLPEINEFALLKFIYDAKKVLRKGGYIYIRDHLYQTGDKTHKGGHKLDTESELKKAGFESIFISEYKDNLEIYGTPRIYQKKI